MYGILFMVKYGNVHVLITALDREEAKRRSFPWIGADPDYYIVTPLTEPGDRIKLDITVST